MAHWDINTIELRELFKILYLKRANMVIGIEHHSIGGIVGIVESSIILAHNHASLEPSKANKDFTQKVCDTCKIFDISLLDHLIVTSEGYYSFCDEDLI